MTIPVGLVGVRGIGELMVLKSTCVATSVYILT